MNKFIFLIICFCSACFAGPTVVVVGGGPAGLAAAIEAQMAGADVTVVEKRDKYERARWIFLTEYTLQLFEKWGLSKEVGIKRFIPINAMEEALDKRREELGIKKIYATFTELTDFPYDILIGADGSHSQVRNMLGISTKTLGTATGILAAKQNNSEKAFTLTDYPSNDGYFLRQIDVPGKSIVFLQSSTKKISLDVLKQKTSIEDPFFVVVDIQLQQAQTFSNKEKSAIIIGDAAAVGSFYQGTGANNAFKTAEIAGNFLKNLSYEEFNEAMQKNTDELIQDNLFLFKDCAEKS